MKCRARTIGAGRRSPARAVPFLGLRPEGPASWALAAERPGMAHHSVLSPLCNQLAKIHGHIPYTDDGTGTDIRSRRGSPSLPRLTLPRHNRHVCVGRRALAPPAIGPF